MTDYEPGTVAVATVEGVKGVRVIRSDVGSGAWFSGVRIKGNHWHWAPTVADIRPLVVLDLDDPTAVVEYLKTATDGFDKAAHGMHPWAGRGPLRTLTRQIEAQTKPPRIPEPGLWGVVEAKRSGSSIPERFVRKCSGNENGGYDWATFNFGTPSESLRWDDLVNPVLIREGVE